MSIAGVPPVGLGERGRSPYADTIPRSGRIARAEPTDEKTLRICGTQR
jgi:hypothetical protein